MNSHQLIGGTSYWQFRNDANMCLGVTGGSNSGGAQLVQGPCGGPGDLSQFWNDETESRVGGVLFRNGNGNRTMCMGLRSSGTTGGTPAVLGQCNTSSPTQSWRF